MRGAAGIIWVCFVLVFCIFLSVVMAAEDLGSGGCDTGSLRFYEKEDAGDESIGYKAVEGGEPHQNATLVPSTEIAEGEEGDTRSGWISWALLVLMIVVVVLLVILIFIHKDKRGSRKEAEENTQDSNPNFPKKEVPLINPPLPPSIINCEESNELPLALSVLYPPEQEKPAPNMQFNNNFHGMDEHLSGVIL